MVVGLMINACVYVNVSELNVLRLLNEAADIANALVQTIRPN
jgi:hypothetical protein